MYDNDYIIAVNENGQPYIAHAYATDNKGTNTRQGWKNAIQGAGSGKRGFHKYLAKGIMNGKMFYAYTQQELDRLRGKAKNAAKKAWGSKAGRFIDSHDAGITEAIMRKRLLRKSKKALKNGNKTDAARYVNRAEELRTESARERNAAKESIKNAGKRAVKSIDDLGVDDYIRWKRAQRRGTNSTENLQKYQNAEYQWRNSKIGKRATTKKKK